MRPEELTPILLDRKLAQLGDAFINLAYSLALTRRLRHPVGTKVSDKVLADAARKAGIRRLLPRRMSRGDVSNAIESLAAYAWLNHQLTIDEASIVLEKHVESPSDAFASLSSKILDRLLSR